MAECLLLKTGGAYGSDDCTASKAQVLSGYTAITSDSDDEPVQGTIPSKSAATYYATTSDQTINQNQYLSGAQTIKGLTQTNLSGANIKPGVTIKINNGNADVWSVPSTMTNKGAATYYATTSDQTIASGQYLSGAQTIKGLTQTNLSGANIKPGVTIKINNGNTDVWSVPSTMTSKAAATYYATTSDQTIAAGQYLSGAQTIKKLTQTNLSAGNILRGKTITINNGSSNVWSVTGSSNVLTTSVQQVTSGLTRKAFTIKANGSSTTRTYYMYYADINPGMTPALVFCLSGELFMWREPNAFFNMIANSYATGGEISITGTFNTPSDAPFTSTTLRVFFATSGGGYVRIFGY